MQLNAGASLHQLRTAAQHLRQISHHSFWRGICFERPNDESLAKRARGNVVPEFVVNHDGANIEKVCLRLTLFN
jgi:hypothetical protein